MDIVPTCPICDKESSPYRRPVEAGWFGKVLKYDQCSKCGLTYQNPRPSRKMLKEYYGSGNYHKSYAPNDGEERARAERINTLVDRFELNPKSCLDVGCRRGFLLQQLQVYNFATILGLEYNPSMPKIKEFVTSEEDVKGKYDLVTCIQVLEQMHDPVEAVKWMASLLNPGGTLLIEVQMDEKLHLPRLYNFTRDSLGRLLVKLDLKHVILNLGPVCDILVGDKFIENKTEKVVYSYTSPDLSSRDEYLK